MNKNLKKVISTVAALAISASAVSAFAVNFPDVPEDANYAQAVQELSALGVINGFEDGTFRPDELVTRAQMAKMIVDALAETEQAEASKANSQFNDVSADHWARGYVNQGVADGFIAGYSSTEFGPDDNVTYVQAQKMLVSAIGYETYAQGSGGWPNGYKTWAASQGITDGISGIADDTQLTRAQVARLIDNAMGAPVCVIKDYDTTWDGRRVPNLEIKDTRGGDGYQTLFTKMHDAYKVYGRVIETSKAGALDNDQVQFQVEKADNFDDEYIGQSAKCDRVTRDEPMYFGDTKADKMEQTYAQALIQKDENDEFTILSIVAAAANKTASVVAEDLDTSKTSVGDNLLYFYPAGTTKNSVKYEIADDVAIYVNGVKVNETLATAYNKYIDGAANELNKITLEKTTDTGSTSTGSKYNLIMITTYVTAVVDQVVEKNDSTTINFKNQTAGIKASLKVDYDNDSKKYTFTYDGAAIKPEELVENDVLTISYNVEEAFADSDFYDVIVSRDTAEGKYTGKNSAGDEFTVGNVKYKKSLPTALTESTEYTLYLDTFGRIAYADENSSTKKVGIIKSVYRKNNGDYAAELFDKEGNLIEYTMDYGNATKDAQTGVVTGNGGAAQVATVFGGTASDSSSYVSGLNGKLAALATTATSTQQAEAVKADYLNQVVDYKVSSSGKLTIQKFYTNSFKDQTGNDAGKYREASDRIGNIKISDATTILDLSSVSASKKDEVKLVSRDTLKDDAYYEAAGYDLSNSVYRFVIITDGFGGIDSTSQIAIFVESGTDEDANEDEVVTVTAYVNSEEVTLFVDNDETATENAAKALKEGEPFVYSVNGEGDIDEIIPLFDGNPDLGNYSYNQFKSNAYNGTIKVNSALTVVDAAKKTYKELSDEDEDVTLLFGIVVKDGNSGYKLVTTMPAAGDANAYVDLDQAISLTTAGAQIYTYNYKNNKKNAGRLSYGDGMSVTPNVTAAYLNGDDSQGQYSLANENVEDDVVFALVRAYNEDDAQEIYLIVSE